MKIRTKLKPTSSLVDLTPLVDVVFLMLIFFMITSDILPLKSLQIESPKLSQDSSPLTTQLIVVMDAEQVIYVGSKKSIVDLSTVQDKLKEEIEALQTKNPGADTTVVLSVDRRVDYGMFLQLFALVQANSPKLRLAYQTEE